MKDVIRTLLGEKIWFRLGRAREYSRRFGTSSYSQEGEDMILRRLFEGTKRGFYIDVGAHHPFRFSNTYFFYKRGWKGLNIDATPGSMSLFRLFRGRDTNAEVPISSSAEELEYFLFEEPALNSFDAELSSERVSRGWQLRGTVRLNTETLSDVIERHVPKGKEVDFLSIDVEGRDLDVLKSANLSKHRPKCILVEVLSRGFQDVLDSDVSRYLLGFGYEPYSKTVNTVFYLDRNWKGAPK